MSFPSVEKLDLFVHLDIPFGLEYIFAEGFPIVTASSIVVDSYQLEYVGSPLQAAELGDKPQLIRIETRAGHGSGKPTDKVIAEGADVLAFLGHFTGLEPVQENN